MTTHTFHIAVRRDYSSLSEKLQALVPLLSLIDDEEGGYRTWYEVNVEVNSHSKAYDTVDNYLEEEEDGEVEVCTLVEIDGKKQPMGPAYATG